MGNGNLLEDIKRTQKISTRTWGEEELPRKNIHVCIWTILPGLTEKLLRNNQPHLFPKRKFKFEGKLKQGDMHRGFIIKKDVHLKELTEKAKLFVYQPFSLNQSSQKHQEALT